MRTVRFVDPLGATPSDPDSPERWLSRNRRLLIILTWTAILVVGLFFRTAGLFRGLDAETTYHPDSPKQVMSFHNYVNYRYIWYDGTLFMDGYPLFLNHVDEWITRPLFALKESAVAHLYGAHEIKRLGMNPHEDYYPRGWWLFYWLQSLRVFYSILILIGAYKLARILGMGRPISFFVATMMSLSPMEWVLAHNATGDIGVTLFGVAMWLALARHVRTSGLTSLLLAGLLGGFAFASKYQGLLVCGVAYMYLLIRHLGLRVEWKSLASRLFTFTAGLLAGIVIATPQFFINPRPTRKLIFENIEFIKNYQVPKEILDLPFMEKAWLGIQKNTWPLLQNLGLILLTLALLGAVLAAVQVLSRRKRGDLDAAARAGFAFSLFILPFYCLVLSLIGKYNVQPFHFAYVMVPLILSAAYLIRHAWTGRLRAGKLAALVAIPVLLLSDAGLMVREYYFWVREDTVEVMKHFQNSIFEPFDQRPPDIRPVRRIHVEPENLPVFRNRHQVARLPFSTFWRELEMAPVPSIPFPARLHWIFDNGPVYPRNDRMFVIPANQTVKKSIVWDEKSGYVKLGIRTGLFPSWITVRIGHTDTEYRLPPHSQMLLDLPVDAIRELIPASRDEYLAWQLPITVSTRNAAAWATVLTTERAVLLFQLFGGDLDAFPEALRNDIVKADEIAGHVERCRYYGSEGDFGFDIAPDRSLPLLQYDPLPAGVYRFSADIAVPPTGATLALLGADVFAGHDWSNSAWKVEYDLPPGLHTITHSFEKSFAPFAYQLSLSASSGRASVVRWEVKPDTRKILENLGHWDTEGERPAWARTQRDEIPDHLRQVRTEEITFGGVFELHRLVVPEQDGNRGELTAFVSIRQLQPMRHIHEQVFFIHFVDENNQTAGVMTFPVYRALNSEGVDIPITVPIDTRLEGRYRMMIGMVSARALKRLSIATTLSDRKPISRRIYMGDAVFVTPLTE